MSASLDATPRAAAQNASSSRRSTGQRLASWASGSPQVAMTAVRAGGGIAVAVVLWWIVASAGVLPAGSVPTPLRVAHDLVVNRAYYATNAGPTTVTALEGFALAAVVSLVFGVLGSLTALLERSVSRVALAIYCLPLPALLPLISSLAAPGQPTRVTMAALFSFFPMLVGVLTGLRSTPADAAAIVHCAGGGRVQILLKVGLRSALPNIMSGMRIAGPGALLGALVAEFSGAQDGLGVALVVSQQKLQTAQTWGLAIVATVIGGLMYAVLTTIARWLHADPAEGRPMPGAGHGPGIARRVADVAVPPVALLLLWIVLVRFVGASPLVFKSPEAVLDYLFKGSTAAMHRSALASDWGITMEHTGIIFAIGMASAAVISCILVSVPLLVRLSAPLLLASQCVPQIAFIPLLVAICGRGVALIAVTGLLVVFFPAMIVIITALEERSQSSIDVISAYGGGKWAVLRFGRLPGAIPGLLSAARISIPLSLFGALVAEWLVTGTGISEAMSTADVTFDYTRLWADVAVMTVTVTVLYAAVSALYERSLRRFAG
jgi:sulfonate transport system permease protein